MPIVCDASALVEVGLRSEAGGRVLDAIRGNDAASPDLVNAEVLQAFRRLVNAGTLTAARAQAAVDLTASIALRRVGTTGLIARAWSLRQNLTAYDAMYVALAERLRCPLVTSDARLAASPGVEVPIVLL